MRFNPRVICAALTGAAFTLAGCSSGKERDSGALKAFLFERMYRHPRVMTTMARAKEVVAELFDVLSADPTLLPADWADRCGVAGDSATGGVVRDYIAGMTDSFALSEYERLLQRPAALSSP